MQDIINILHMKRRLWVLLSISLSCVCLHTFAAATAPANMTSDYSKPIGGLYNVVSSSAGMDEDGFKRTVGIGKLILDSRNHSFVYKALESGMALTRFCRPKQDNPQCEKSYVRDETRGRRRVEGKFTVKAEGRILFEVNNAQSKPVRVVEGFYSRDGEVLLIPFNFDNQLQFSLSLRSSMFQPRHAGGDYAMSQIGDSYPRFIDSEDGNWRNFSVNVATGTLSIEPGAYRLKTQKSDMLQDVSCKMNQNSCHTTAELSFLEKSRFTRGKLHLHGNGKVVFSDTRNDTPASGFMSENQSLIAAIHNGLNGRIELRLFTRKGVNMRSSDLVGQFNVFTQEQFLNDEGEVLITNPTGKISFDGAGNWRFDGHNSGSLREECNTEFPPSDVHPIALGSDVQDAVEACSGARLSYFGPFPAGAAGSYELGGDGKIVMSGIDTGGGVVEFTGSLSADAKIFTLRRIADSVPCAIGCATFESARSLIIGIF